MSTVGVLVAGACVVWFALKSVFRIFQLYRAYRIASLIPGPGLGLVVKYFSKGKKAFTLSAASDAILEIIQKYKPTLKFWSGPVLIVMISEPRDLEYLFTNKELLNKSTIYRILEPLMGKGLLLLNGGVWRKHRKALTPYLHSDILREYMQEFHDKAVTFADRLGAASQGGKTVVDLRDYLGMATADMICKTVLATEISAQDSEVRRFVRATSAAMMLLLLRVMCPWYQNKSVFRLCSKHYKHYVRVEKTIDQFISRIVYKKRENKECRQMFQRGRRAFIDLVLDSEQGGQLSDEEVREETKTIVTVAAGGTTDTLGFLFQALALRQDIQARVVRELTTKLDEAGGRLCESVVSQLAYLDRVVKETLRMFPAIPLFARAVHRDTKLPSGVIVPRGAHLVACILTTHRDERNFPDPMQFDPDRHLPERRAQAHPFAYVPFSAGPRNCIGQRYAMLAIKTVVATVLTRYRLFPGEATPRHLSDIRLNIGVTLTGRDGYKIRLVPRNSFSFVHQPVFAPAEDTTQSENCLPLTTKRLHVTQSSSR